MCVLCSLGRAWPRCFPTHGGAGSVVSRSQKRTLVLLQAVPGFCPHRSQGRLRGVARARVLYPSCRRPAPAPRLGSAGGAAAHAHAQWRRREPCLLHLLLRLPVPQSLPAAVSLWLHSERLLTVNLQHRSGQAAATSAESGRGAGGGARGGGAAAACRFR